MGCAAGTQEGHLEQVPTVVDQPKFSQVDNIPDNIQPVLPKFEIQDPDLPQPEQHHELLMDEPELDNAEIQRMQELDRQMKQLYYEQTVQNARESARKPEPKAGEDIVEIHPASLKHEDPRPDEQTSQRPRVKKLIRQRKPAAEFEFNDNHDAQMVVVKEKGVFDQIEREQMQEIKNRALQRPGSASAKRDDIPDF